MILAGPVTGVMSGAWVSAVADQYLLCTVTVMCADSKLRASRCKKIDEMSLLTCLVAGLCACARACVSYFQHVEGEELKLTNYSEFHSCLIAFFGSIR